MAGFVGTDSFNYEIADESGEVDQATVTVNVLPDSNGPENDAPFAVDDFATTTKRVPVEGDLLANDVDPNGDSLTINMIPVQQPSNGTLVINRNGTFIYTPNPGHEGTDSFVYEVCDPDGVCSQATAYITTFNHVPIAVDDEFDLATAESVNGNVLNNDSDPDGDPLTASLMDEPLHGTVILNSDGTFTYTPGATFAGNDSFTYEVCDDTGACSSATVTFTLPFAFDSLNNEALRDPFATQSNRIRNTLLIEKIHALDPEPIVAGYAKPGKYLVARIYATDGSVIGERSAVASRAGTFVMHFFGTQPTAGSYIVIDHVSSEQVESSVNHGFRLTNFTYRSMQLGTQHRTELTIGSILADMPSRSLHQMHLENKNPLTLLD